MTLSNEAALNVVLQTHDWLNETGITYDKANIIKKFLDNINSCAYSFRIHTSIRGNCFSIDVDDYDYDDFTCHRIPVFSARWYLS